MTAISSAGNVVVRNRCLASAHALLGLSHVSHHLQVGEIATGQATVHVSMNRKNPHLCLVSFSGVAPAQLDFGEERSQTLPYLQMGELFACHSPGKSC